jgi:hypothetical protein
MPGAISFVHHAQTRRSVGSTIEARVMAAIYAVLRRCD